MSGAKKITTVFDDQVNANIQRKFDLVFNVKPGVVTPTKTNKDSAIFNNDEIDIQFGSGAEDEFVMEKNSKNKDTQINLDLSDDEDTPAVPANSASAMDLNDDGLDFSLNFDLDAANESEPIKAAIAQKEEDSAGFTLDEADLADSSMDFNEATKKTVMISSSDFQKANLENFSLEETGSHNGGSADHMSKEESRASIESTIKDILRPKIEDTKEIDINGLESNAGSPLDEIENSELAFRENTPPNGFSLDAISDDDFAIERSSVKKVSAPASNDSTGEFDIGDMETDFNADDTGEIFDTEPAEPILSAPKAAPISTPEPASKPDVVAAPVSSSYDTPPSMGMGGSNMTSEDGMRFQATIRALREEREEMLQQIKNLKSDSKELEQDNLTLKANLDEAKIEITILRKRHMVELEDIKYRLTMSEEKKAMADEKARQADMRREKLEQKVRIDFNQVKQREKELESKLELLSMDVDSQVQSRDHKILELRRKIDALEFNMENASIKEQKSLDDKRKLEDRLNKIMKTLRHSIKNLEDDIDHAQVDDDHQKEKN